MEIILSSSVFFLGPEVIFVFSGSLSQLGHLGCFLCCELADLLVNF